MNTPYFPILVYLLSSLISAVALVLLYFLITIFLSKDLYWFLRLKQKKAILMMVIGVMVIVAIERWLEQVVPALQEKQNVIINVHDGAHKKPFGKEG